MRIQQLLIKLRKEGNRWTSSRITTKGKFDFTYGRVDVRIWTRRVDGPFPAVWLLSSKCCWPKQGEIDIFEMQTQWNYIPAALHFQDHHRGKALSYHNSDTNTARWRVYSVDWQPNYIAFSHDGREIGRYNKPRNANRNKFHLIINNAMQPSWGKGPRASLKEHNLYIDYVKVWK